MDKVDHIEEINKVLQSTKLNASELVPISQKIHFNEHCIRLDDYKFLELNKHLEKTLAVGGTLYINGEPEETTKLCTDDYTFEISTAEASNSMLIATNLKFHDDLNKDLQGISNVQVSGIFHKYLEAKECKPEFKKIQSLLEKSIYKGPELEFQIPECDKYSFDDFSAIIQASKRELKKTLKILDTIIINDKIRLLDFEYHFKALSYMLKLIDENSWQLDEVSFEDTVTTLADLIPSEIISSLFEKYTEESKIVDFQQLYRYKTLEVCQFFAKVILHNCRKFKLKDFLQAWQESVPEGMVVDESMLNGVAIVNRKVFPHVVWRFDESDLPENVIERFNALFSAKDKWSIHEISPYIQNITTESLDVNALLAKHARSSKIDGEKFYSSKHK